MKIISIVVLWIVITLFQGCTLFENKNPLNKYEEKIKNYYLENLNDPKSYESIKTDILYQSNESTIIKHTYRTKNTFNALIKDTSYFIMLPSNMIEINSLIYKSFNELIGEDAIGIPRVRGLEEMYHPEPFADIFNRLGMSREGVANRMTTNYILNTDKKKGAKFFCDVVSNNSEHNKIKYILQKNYEAKYMILFDLVYQFPNEMSEILSDSYYENVSSVK